MTTDLRARPLLVVLLLVVAAAAAGWLFLRTRHTSSNPTQVAPAVHRPAVRTAAARHAAPELKPRPAKAKPAPAPADQLPVAIRRALAADRVVVVALYDPQAKIDSTAVREARAGAALAGSSFVPVNVAKPGVAALNLRYGVIQDPAVLVLRPPGSLVVRIDGFADRDTVAQAAVNAAS